MVDEGGLDIVIAYTEDLLSRNIMFEYYTADLGNHEEETVIFARFKDKNAYYSYTLYYTDEISNPLLMSMIIKDAVEVLQHSSDEDLQETLDSISTGVIISNAKNKDASLRRVYEMEDWKFRTALELIEASRH